MYNRTFKKMTLLEIFETFPYLNEKSLENV